VETWQISMSPDLVLGRPSDATLVVQRRGAPVQPATGDVRL
jgi:hypothetical protein